MSITHDVMDEVRDPQAVAIAFALLAGRLSSDDSPIAQPDASLDPEIASIAARFA